MGKKVDRPLDQMKEWYEAGETCEQIGQRLGTSFGTVGKVLRRNGVKMRPRGWCDQSGEKNRFWRGGRSQDVDGYILVYQPDHPYADSHGRVREHRLVAESVLGRYLLPAEVVHHKDDDPSNNDPENLQVFDSNADHLAETLKGKVPRWTEEGRQSILESVRRPRKRKAILPESG